MTTPIPTPGGDDGAEDAVIKEAEALIFSETEQINVEAIFTLAIRVGIMLNKWQELMKDHFTTPWIEVAAMTIFNKYFTPFVPPWNDDDDVQSG